MSKPLKSRDLSLNVVLTKLGYTTRTATSFSMGCKHIDKAGKTVFTGDAGEVWAWLRSTKQIATQP